MTTAVVLAPGRTAAEDRGLLAATQEARLAVGAGTRLGADRAQRCLAAVASASWTLDDAADRDPERAARGIVRAARDAGAETLVFPPTRPGEPPLATLVAELAPELRCVTRPPAPAAPTLRGFRELRGRTPQLLTAPEPADGLTLLDGAAPRSRAAEGPVPIERVVDTMLARLGWSPHGVALDGAAEREAGGALVIARGDDAEAEATRIAHRRSGTLALSVVRLERHAHGEVELEFADGRTARVTPSAERPLVVAARPRPGEGPGFADADPRGRFVAIGGHGAGEAAFAVLHALAELLGGEVAGSRPAVEAGHATVKVGLTGVHVAPRVLLMAGVSGAAHHRAGIGAAGCRIVIDRDASTPMLAQADIPLVGDAATLLGELAAELRGRFGAAA